MGEIELERVAEAWRRASDADLGAALSSPDDLEPDVLSLVQQEAARRGLDAATIAPGTPRNRSLPRALVIGAKLRKVVFGFLSEHSYLVAGSVAALLAILGTTYSATVATWLGRAWPLWTVTLLLTYLAVVAFCARPLRSHRRVLLVSLAGSSCFTTVMQLTFLLRYGVPPQEWLAPISVGWLLSFAILWAVPSLILCGVVGYRRRWRPEYGPGKCAQCGYDLRGLVEPRCPECGTAFDADQTNSSIQQDTSAGC